MALRSAICRSDFPDDNSSKSTSPCQHSKHHSTPVVNQHLLKPPLMDQASKRRSWQLLRVKSDDAVLSQRRRSTPSISNIYQRARPASEIRLTSTTSFDNASEDREVEPWVHKEGPLILSTDIDPYRRQLPTREPPPPPPPVPRIPSVYRSQHRSRSPPRLVCRQSTVPDLSIQEQTPGGHRHTMIAPPTPTKHEVESRPSSSNSFSTTVSSERPSLLASRSTSPFMRYYPIATSLLDLPIPAPSISAQFPEDALRAEVAHLRLKVVELEDKVAEGEREKEEAVRNAEEEWRKRVAWLERERQTLLAERREMLAAGQRAMSARLPAQGAGCGGAEGVQRQEEKKWWDW